MRDATVGYMLSTLPGLDHDHVIDAEIGVFNASIAYAKQHGISCAWTNPRFRLVYDHKARSLVSNMDATTYVQNDRLMARVQGTDGLGRGGEAVAGEDVAGAAVVADLAPHDIALLPRDHVFPERWSSVINKKNERDKFISTARPMAMTDQFKCSRCMKRECSFVELQTRSCDEPATLFIQCVKCGYRWRIG
jgi:DNA-directed RNA polymerase subunit M/transcription elongation factor TFIIS